MQDHFAMVKSLKAAPTFTIDHTTFDETWTAQGRSIHLSVPKWSGSLKNIHVPLRGELQPAIVQLLATNVGGRGPPVTPFKSATCLSPTKFSKLSIFSERHCTVIFTSLLKQAMLF